MPTAPVDLKANLAYRRKLLELAGTSQSAREEMLIAASRDPVWFVNSWLYTYDPQNHSEAPIRALVAWPYQEEAIRRTAAAIGKHNLIFPKSRRMGVTTLIMAVFFWRWCFRPMQSFLLCSSKEDRVDAKGDPSCLMWKSDFFLECLPQWMRPPVDRTQLTMLNLENQSVINGESTNSDPDRGGVRTAALLDEAASMKNAANVVAAVQPLTNSVLLASTPKGAFGAFYDLYTKWSAESPEWVIKLHWTQHPRFSAGLYHDEQGKPRSPWYDNECKRAIGPRWIAQELDIGFNEAGGQYFEGALIERLLKQVRKPSATGEINTETDEFMPLGTGRLLLWCPLDDHRRPPRSSYVVGVDPSQGMGGEMGSNSSLSVVDAETGVKVAEFKTPRMPPATFARYAVSVCRFFHGAKLIWGSQGPGVTFGKIVTEECAYGNVFYREDESTVGKTKTRKTGYVEMGESRQVMFDTYQDALHNGRFVNYSEEALKECRQFIIGPNGTIEHSKALQADDPESKGKLHGDIVIADALANRLLNDVRPAQVERNLPPPKGSPAWFMREAARRRQVARYY